MTKFVSYTVVGDDVKKDSLWRQRSICGIDKEYSIISKSNSTFNHFARFKIRVSDDTVILFKLRYPNCKITSL